jgi:hypothetical protein
VLSINAQVALAPEGTYRRLVAEPARVRWWHALARPALVLLVMAVALPVMAVRTITVQLVFVSAAAWSLVVLVQIAMALPTIAWAPGRTVSVPRALDLWFAGHLPYSAWILLLPVITSIRPDLPALNMMAITFAVPTVWTTFIITAFCRRVLGAMPAGARWRAALHQVVSIAVVVTLALWAAGGLASVTSYILRMLGRN